MAGIQKINPFSFIKWLSSQYVQLEKNIIPYAFKLGYFEKNKQFIVKNGKIVARVELSGQAEAFDLELFSLVEKNLFEYFSPADKKKIFNVYYNKERYKLMDRYYCPKEEVEMVVLTDILTNNIKTIPAHLVTDDDELMEQMPRCDVKKISYLSAMDFFKNIFKAGAE